MTWAGKPCQQCGGKKGPNYRTAKHCGNCVKAIARQRKDRAHEQGVMRRYGLAEGEYRLILAAQGGFCPICLRANGRTRRLSVDHDHRTGDVRGLLCRPCNDMLGHARDDPTFFARAATYLIDPPASRVLSGRPSEAQDPGLDAQRIRYPSARGDLGSAALSTGYTGLHDETEGPR